MQLIENIQENTPVQLVDLDKVFTLSQMIVTIEGSVKKKRISHEVLASYVQKTVTSPVITLLDFESVWKERVQVEEEDVKKYPDQDFPTMMEHFKDTQSSQVHIMH